MQKLLVIILVFFSTVLTAQKKNFIIEGTVPNFYISHKVTAGESFYSVGRKYNQTPQAIADFNNLVSEKGLLLGQTIKVPLTSQNLAASDKAEAGETIIPLYHVVAKNETLFRISNNLGVAVPEVKLWNNLSSDEIAVGNPLIVGHLKLSANATATTQKIVASTGDSSTTNLTSETKTPSANSVKEEPVATAKAEDKKEEPVVKSAEKKEEPVAKVEEKKQEPTPAKTEGSEAVTPQSSTSSLAAQPVEQPNVQAKEEEKKIDLLAPQPETSYEGVFSELYPEESDKSLLNKTGDAATFKTTSGWQDKKYYVLMNNVPPGTILKITSADNKVVFAKVLGSMPEMKENKGLLLRISNAAASYLGIVDSKFPVQVSFYR